jgi:hypothetical protein
VSTAVFRVKRISAKDLLALLAPSREYLAGRGLVLPQEANHPVDYETLASILVDPSPDRPKALIDGLYFVHEMSTSECMADLLDAAAPGVLDFEGAEPTPADVAVQVCLKDRDLLDASPLRIGFSFPARVRRGLTLAGPQCRVQFPTQPLAFAPQPVDLFPQPLVFLLRPSIRQCPNQPLPICLAGRRYNTDWAFAVQRGLSSRCGRFHPAPRA